MTLPLGGHFPGTAAAAAAASKPGSKIVLFATAGEKGSLRLWRSDSGACLYEKAVYAEGTAFSSADELTDLLLAPGGAGLVAATSDARLLFYGVQVRRSGVGARRYNADGSVLHLLMVGAQRCSPDSFGSVVYV